MEGKSNSAVETLPRKNQWGFAAGSAAFTMLERLLLLYVPFYFHPPREYQIPHLAPEEPFWGVVTLLGIALALGRIIDALADPLIAHWSDNSRWSLGRRRPFLLGSALPLSAFTVMVFYPPLGEQETLLHGLWLAIMMGLFYLAFTAYVNPYLALISELGHTDATRINISTMVALGGMLGMILITVLFPEGVSLLQDSGVSLRASYQWGVLTATFPSLLLLYLASFSFNEARHCKKVESPPVSLITALAEVSKVLPFRRFVGGEVFMQFSMNIVTLGMMYYAVVIFRQEQRFMTVLAILLLGSALLSFPFINQAAKKWGKSNLLTYCALLLSGCAMAIFLMSFNMEGIYFYLSLVVFALAGIPSAAFSILVNPTIAEIARSEAVKTGERREGTFFAARAVPIKATIALAGGVFSFLLSSFGRSVTEPLGVQLTILLVSLAGLAGFLMFRRYPEKKVQQALQEEETAYHQG